MHPLKHHYGPAEGPLGFPMLDKQARALAAVLQSLPTTEEYAYRKHALSKATAELLPGERADVSWISTEDPDRENEVVLARGMDDGHFKLNPIVTLNHSYDHPPVGRSIWRKVVRGGVKAKTVYPPRPDGWPADDGACGWPPDVAFGLVQAELLNGKSIGFLPTKVRTPDEKELARPGWQNVRRIIEEWILLEYACCFLPIQQNAVVEAVSKSMPESFRRALGIPGPEPGKGDRTSSITGPVPFSGLGPGAVPFTPFDEIEKVIARQIAVIDFSALARRAFRHGLERARGRI